MKRLLLISSIVLSILSCENKNGDNTMAANNEKADSSKAEKMESKEDRNKKIVKDAMDALNNHNIEKLVGMMSDDAVDYGDGMGRSVKGKDSIRNNMMMFFNAFPDFKGSETRFFADGDHVVVLAEYSGTFKKDLGKMKATNKSFKFPDADVFTLTEDGKISSHRSIQPDATLFGQVTEKKK
jgi:steroid delta-isomerase-like uncharacterized protein